MLPPVGRGLERACDVLQGLGLGVALLHFLQAALDGAIGREDVVIDLAVHGLVGAADVHQVAAGQGDRHLGRALLGLDLVALADPSERGLPSIHHHRLRDPTLKLQRR